MAELPHIETIRSEYVEYFKQKIDTKTCALIEFIEAERWLKLHYTYLSLNYYSNYYLSYTYIILNLRKLHDTVNVDDIKTYLSIRRDSDLIAIFAASEYYKPGLCSWLNGQPSFRGYLPGGTNHWSKFRSLKVTCYKVVLIILW